MQAGKTHPNIKVSSDIGKAINQNKGLPAVVTLLVKYKREKDWIEERLWLVPGWDQSELWKLAYKWLYNDARLMYYTSDEIENLRFCKFKLV